MDSLQGRKKWTAFHTEAAKKVFKKDIEKLSRTKASGLSSKLKAKRELLECRCYYFLAKKIIGFYTYFNSENQRVRVKVLDHKPSIRESSLAHENSKNLQQLA